MISTSYDFQIPLGQTSTIAAITTAAVGIDRFCGRHLSTATVTTGTVPNIVTTGSDTETTVCSRSYPFRLGVVTDNMEVCTDATAVLCEVNIDAASMPGGIVGFALGYDQKSC